MRNQAGGVSLRRGPAKAWSDLRGTAALEFVFLIPVLSLALAGLYAGSELIRAKMLLSSAASNMADMITVETSVTGGSSGTLHDFCTGAQLVMTPFPVDTLAVAVASYTLQPNMTIKQDWEYDGACPTVATSLTATAPSGMTLVAPLLTNAGDSVIAVQASYTYISSYSNVVPSIAIQQTAYSRPRAGPIMCSSGC